MYAIVKTGGKQYKVAPGDIIEIEKLDAEEGSKVELEAICIVDGDKVESDPAKAAATKVVAEVLEQFKGEKQLVFKFKKRKNYKRTKGHRQQLTRVRIVSVGAEKAAKTADAKKAEAPKKAASKKDDAPKKEEAPKKASAKKDADVKEEKPAKAAKAEAEEVVEQAEEAKETAEKAAEEE